MPIIMTLFSPRPILPPLKKSIICQPCSCLVAGTDEQVAQHIRRELQVTLQFRQVLRIDFSVHQDIESIALLVDLISQFTASPAVYFGDLAQAVSFNPCLYLSDSRVNGFLIGVITDDKR